MAQVIWTRNAVFWLRYTLVYGYARFGHASAEKLNNAIKLYGSLLACNPLLGQREQLLADKADYTYRSVLIHSSNYKLIYRTEPDESETASTVYIVDIWDTRMNPDTLADRI